MLICPGYLQSEGPTAARGVAGEDNDSERGTHSIERRPGGQKSSGLTEGDGMDGMNEWQGSGRGQRVEIWTDKYRLMGYIFVPEETGRNVRLSDVINDPDRPFLPMVRVAMYQRGGDELLMEQEFLLVNLAAIEILRPLD